MTQPIQTVGDCLAIYDSIKKEIISNPTVKAQAEEDFCGLLTAKGMSIDPAAVAFWNPYFKAAIGFMEYAPTNPALTQGGNHLDLASISNLPLSAEGPDIADITGVRAFFNGFGFVIQLSEPVTRDVINGMNVMAMVTAAIARAVGTGSPLIGGISAVTAVFLMTSVTILAVVDHAKKGVYLTYSYPQMACICALTPPLPGPVS